MSILHRLSAGEERLWKMIAERGKRGDKQEVDKKIWDLFGERWAVMFTDLSGFSRSVETFGIIHFLQVIHDFTQLAYPIIDEHQGFVLKVEGDSLLALFRRPESALSCARQMQAACASANETRPPEEALLLCLGLGYGDVLRVGEHEVFGAEVNAASKLGEDTAKAHEILVTQKFREACADAGNYEKLEEKIPGAEAAYRYSS